MRFKCHACGAEREPLQFTQTPAPEATASRLLRELAVTGPVQRWKEFEERGEERIPCFIQVWIAKAIAEWYSSLPQSRSPE